MKRPCTKILITEAEGKHFIRKRFNSNLSIYSIFLSKFPSSQHNFRLPCPIQDGYPTRCCNS